MTATLQPGSSPQIHHWVPEENTAATPKEAVRVAPITYPLT